MGKAGVWGLRVLGGGGTGDGTLCGCPFQHDCTLRVDREPSVRAIDGGAGDPCCRRGAGSIRCRA